MRFFWLWSEYHSFLLKECHRMLEILSYFLMSNICKDITFSWQVAEVYISCINETHGFVLNSEMVVVNSVTIALRSGLSLRTMIAA